MKCIVLAAGKGVRMMPLTDKMPKPLIPLGGKPFLYYVLRNAFISGIHERDVGVVVGYKKEMIEQWLRDDYPEITPIYQQEQKGTGHAVAVCERFIGHENFVTINGDDLYDPIDIRKLTTRDDGLCYGIGYPNQDVTKYAAMLTDDDGFLVHIIEKPTHLTSEISRALANANLWKFTPEVFDCLRKVKLSPRGEYEITDASQMLADRRKMKILQASGYWEKFGCPEDVGKMEKFFKGTLYQSRLGL